MTTFAVILPAAGKSLRFGDKHYKKPFINLAGRAVLDSCGREVPQSERLQAGDSCYRGRRS